MFRFLWYVRVFLGYFVWYLKSMFWFFWYVRVFLGLFCIFLFSSGTEKSLSKYNISYDLFSASYQSLYKAHLQQVFLGLPDLRAIVQKPHAHYAKSTCPFCKLRKLLFYNMCRVQACFGAIIEDFSSPLLGLLEFLRTHLTPCTQWPLSNMFSTIRKQL